MQTENTAGFRLSPQQARLWAAQADGTTFRAVCALIIDSKVDPAAVRESILQAAGRYEIFRTTFYRRPGMKLPLQVIHDALVIDWRITTTGNDLAADIEGEVRADSVRPFDLTALPVIRATFLNGNGHASALLLSALALCADAAALRSLADEAFLILAGKAAELNPEPLQYADFSEWANQLLAAEEDEAQTGREFWKHRSLTEPVVGRLPFQCISTVTACPSFVAVSIPEITARRAEALAQRTEVATGAVYLAAWQAVLSRLTGQNEVAVRCLLSGRRQDELRGGIGLFAEFLPVRATVEDQSFASLLREVGNEVSEAYRRQEYYPAEPTALALPQFEFVPWPAITPAAGKAVTLARQFCHTAAFSVKLTLTRTDEGNYLAGLYFADGFAIEDKKRSAGHYERLLAAVVSDPELRPADVDVLNAAEREHLLTVLNRTASVQPIECIHHAIEAIAAAHPNRPAVACAGRRWTYAELNARANQLSQALRRRGVGPDVPVGLCLERSGEMIVGLLGILKAGGAYVPVTPNLPPDRIALQLKSAGAAVLLTDDASSAQLGGAFNGTIIRLDQDRHEIDGESDSNPEHVTGLDDLVYVIFTSGSTGTPKGVAVTHRNLANYTAFIRGMLGVNEPSAECLNFATVSTLAADLGNTSVFPSLVSGGCLHVIPYETALGGRQFAAYAAANPIDVLKITPSHLRALLAEGGGGVLPRRFLVLGGEASSWALIRQIRDAGTCTVINHYGPTETTVGAMTYPVPATSVASDTVPIGRPIANTRAYVVDAKGMLVPFGAPGELCIGGAGVARGYLNQPEQTAAHFVADPFAGDPAARMYKTGDRVRYLADGAIEFLGRVDRQVKIHGFRVEPGEIEAVLQKVTGVATAVVIAGKDAAGADRLVAYVVPSPGATPMADQLREQVKQRLPEYMVPAVFVTIAKLPLTPNGKIDTRALPDPDRARMGSEKPYVAPRTSTEEKIAAVWKEILKVDRVGALDDFFELGGHSLLATQVISRLQAAFDVPIPLRSIFEAPTVAGLAEAITQYRTPESSDDVGTVLADLERMSEEEVNQLLALDGVEQFVV